VRLAYADPPYLGRCSYYDHDHRRPYACWNDIGTHRELLFNLEREYDGYIMHMSVPTLAGLELGAYPDARLCAWVKPFASFKPNQTVGYAWEPVLIKPLRPARVVGASEVMRDWISERMAQKGFTGGKPERVCHWAFDVAGLEPNDELIDLFVGSGAVARAWLTWMQRLPLEPYHHQETLL